MKKVSHNNKATILIIEDDGQYRDFLSELLQLAKFNVVTAKNGKEGIGSIAEDEPDLVLTDIFMPEMDGFEVIMELLATSNPTPVIAMSGHNMNDKASYLDMIAILGAAEILQKPIAGRVLIESIENTLIKNEKYIEKLTMTK